MNVEYVLMGKDELGSEFHVDDIVVATTPETAKLAYRFAEIVVEERRERYEAEYQEEINIDNFWLEEKIGKGNSFEELEYLMDDCYN